MALNLADTMNAGLSFFDLTERYPDEASAIRYFEERRWPGGNVHCPKCGSVEVTRGRQKMRRRQLWYCGGCAHMFSVTSGTVLEFTKLPLRKWLLAFHLMGASKKGISSRQLARMLRVTLQTAWHLSHRIRETMVNNLQMFTGTVETDETYLGGKRRGRGRGYRGNKVAVQTIIRRNRPGRHDSQAQTIALEHEKVDGRTVGAKLRKHTRPDRTTLMTDDSPIYNRVRQNFEDSHAVNHQNKVYAVEADDGCLASTNTAEGYFANLKRKIIGTHHHTSKKHLQRYLEEQDFLYNTRQQSDGERVDVAIGKIENRRLRLYRPKDGGQSLYDGADGEPRRKKKRKVRKTKRTKVDGKARLEKAKGKSPARKAVEAIRDARAGKAA